MARKLFALENLDEESGEMESGTEVTELASVEVEAGDDVKDIVSDAESVEGGVAGAEDAEKVEDFVGDVVEKGGSLDKVAAEALRIAMESICARVGYNPKSVRAMYANENFSSASSCKTSTAIALEGVGEFLKDLWKKIKAAIDSVWTKIKAFWLKHMSSLGRARKALTAAKARVSASSGKFKGQAFIDKAPSSLVNAFAGKEDITANVVKTYLSNHQSSFDGLGSFVKTLQTNYGTPPNPPTEEYIVEVLTKLKSQVPKATLTYGTDAKPLIGGNYSDYTVEVDVEEGTVDISVETQTIEKETELGVSLADKAGLNDIITASSNLLKRMETMIKDSEKDHDAYTKMTGIVEKSFNDELTPDQAKAARKYMKIVYKLVPKTMALAPTVYHNDIRAVKASLMYIDLCVRNYK